MFIVTRNSELIKVGLLFVHKAFSGATVYIWCTTVKAGYRVNLSLSETPNFLFGQKAKSIWDPPKLTILRNTDKYKGVLGL